MTVTVQEVIQALESLIVYDYHGKSEYDGLLDRIRTEGIAPPDGWVLVPIITKATPFNCGINGDPPQVDHARVSPCKIWCGRKECTQKDKP